MFNNTLKCEENISFLLEIYVRNVAYVVIESICWETKVIVKLCIEKYELISERYDCILSIRLIT